MENNPYHTTPNNNNFTPPSRSPLFWTKMFRYSIYFTIAGIILSIAIITLGRQMVTNNLPNQEISPNTEQIESLLNTVDILILASKSLAMFVTIGVISTITSLIMREVEKTRRKKALD